MNKNLTLKSFLVSAAMGLLTFTSTVTADCFSKSTNGECKEKSTTSGRTVKIMYNEDCRANGNNGLLVGWFATKDFNFWDNCDNTSCPNVERNVDAYREGEFICAGWPPRCQRSPSQRFKVKAVAEGSYKDWSDRNDMLGVWYEKVKLDGWDSKTTGTGDSNTILPPCWYLRIEEDPSVWINIKIGQV
ncbi:hypothetical protein HDV05_004148 [Chytridiales sp. JEL 0842]|nr:hypothetical protein HDV05_004148 [Chytridiales sp. JEL 0842]